MVSDGYEVIVDTKGTLLWNDDSTYHKPHIIITSEQVHQDYLEYLDSKNISWVACGKNKIDLVRAVEILTEDFDVKRMGIVGGAAINSAFLEAGLLDEISILIGLGIDGRKGMPAVFDGIPMEQGSFPLTFKDTKIFKDGAVWLQYNVINKRNQ